MKHMKLIALLAAAMMVQGTHAGPKIEKAKQMGTVGIHLAEVVGGVVLGVAGWRQWDQGKSFWERGKGKAFMVLSAPLILKGLHDLKNDLHQHIFYHMDAWWKYKSKDLAKKE
ncbi:hypothetical protein E3J61_01435 [Candidatus Dependentiae bacterium]|nr:MAG: hypothetical protein E3J61_01435 [Candidatus Dependentiae bacterium]